MKRYLAVGLAVVALSGCGSPDYSSKLQKELPNDWSMQNLSALAQGQQTPGGDLSNVQCVQSSGTENYSCVADLATTDANGEAQNRQVSITATCDDNGKCVWHTTN